MQNQNEALLPAGSWPEPKLRALQVEEIYKFGAVSAAFSYFVALLTLGVLVESGDAGRGYLWFFYATAVTVFRAVVIVAYRRRGEGSPPERWARLVMAANFLAGIQWALLGTVLFPPQPGYAQLFVVMTITCLIGGSLTAYAAVRGAHESLALTAGVPSAINLFFVHDGVHWFAGATALFFCFAIVYYGRKLNGHIEASMRLLLQRDELVSLTEVLNEKLQQENRELAHRAAVRGVSVESARERAGRLEALFENSPVPQLECDAAGHVIRANRAAERLFGQREETLSGQAFAGLLAGPYAAGKATAGAHQPINIELQVRGADGAALPCTASFTPLPAPAGRKPGFAVMLTGIAVPADVK